MLQKSNHIGYFCHKCRTYGFLPSHVFQHFIESFNVQPIAPNIDQGFTGECSTCRSLAQIGFSPSTCQPITTQTGRAPNILETIREQSLKGGTDSSIILLQDKDLILPEQEDIYVPNQRIITDIAEIHGTIPKLIELIKEDQSYLYRITTREFEQIIAEIFSSHGFSVELTKKTRDGGKDVIAITKQCTLGIETKYFVECKRHAIDSKVDVSIVREVYGVHNERDGPNKSIIVTTSTFSPDAIKFAEEKATSKWALSLKDVSDVMQWIRNYKPLDILKGTP